MVIEYGHVVAATASLDLAHRSAGLQRAQPAKNAAVVDRMCGSIREFGDKMPVLARSDGEVVDGYLCLKVDGCKINSARCNQMLSLRPRR